MRIEGSLGLPEREFNGPVVGLQERYREGLAALGSGFRRRRRQGAASPARGGRGVLRALVGALLRGHVRRHPSTGATATGSAGPTSTTRATCSHAATATPRCRGRDGRRHHHRLGPGWGHGCRGAHPCRVVGRHHGEGAQPPARPRGPDPPVGGLLQRRDQVHLALLPRARPARRAPGLPPLGRGGGAHPRRGGELHSDHGGRWRDPCRRKGAALSRGGLRAALDARPPGGRRSSRTGPWTTTSSSPTTPRWSRRSGWPGGRGPTRSPPGARAPTRCRPVLPCTGPCCRRPRPRSWGCIPTRPPRRPTASPTTAGPPATTAGSVPSSAAPSMPRATRWHS